VFLRIRAEHPVDRLTGPVVYSLSARFLPPALPDERQEQKRLYALWEMSVQGSVTRTSVTERNGKGGHKMCSRRLLFISMIVAAVAFVTAAQASWPLVQQRDCFIGSGSTDASRSGPLSSAGDGNFEQRNEYSQKCYVPCGTRMNQSSSGYLDQSSSVGGCGGSASAENCAIGGGVQKQKSGYVVGQSTPRCFPYTEQSQAAGGIGVNSVTTACGNNGAAATQTGGISQAQTTRTPITSGAQHQYLSGTQGGMAVGVPTSYTSATGITGGGGIQCQNFGGIH
jgi:hypothetical protein